MTSDVRTSEIEAEPCGTPTPEEVAKWDRQYDAATEEAERAAAWLIEAHHALEAAKRTYIQAAAMLRQKLSLAEDDGCEALPYVIGETIVDWDKDFKGFTVKACHKAK